MSIYKDQEDHLSPSLRRIAAGLSGLQKRVFSDLRKIFGEGYAGKYKSPLFFALATILATLFPVAGAQAGHGSDPPPISCPPSITGDVTLVTTNHDVTTASNTVVVTGGQTCTIESTGNINPPTKENTTRAVELGGHNPTVIHRGTIDLREKRATNYSVPGAFQSNSHTFIAFFITGPGSKVTVDGGTINLPEQGSTVFAVQQGANNPVIEFLSGSASLTNTGSRNIFLLGATTNTNVKLIFGGNALVVGGNPGDSRSLSGYIPRSVFFDDDAGADSEVILLPGALINGKRSRPFSGVYSKLGSTSDPNTDRVMIGNFHPGIPPRTG